MMSFGSIPGRGILAPIRATKIRATVVIKRALSSGILQQLAKAENIAEAWLGLFGYAGSELDNFTTRSFDLLLRRFREAMSRNRNRARDFAST